MDQNIIFLQQMQQVELDIFKEFISICEKLNLRYYLMGGTMLGAVRHGGFIPWDDDIDVGMLREDYEVFMREAPKYLPEHLFLQNHKTDYEYHSNAAKIRNCNTTYIEKEIRFSKINHGVFIDIFPLDYYPDNALEEGLLNLIRKPLTVRIGMVYHKETKENVVKRFCKALLSVIIPDIHIAVEARDKLYKKCRKSSKLANHSGAWGKKEIVPADWYAEGCTLEFEGLKVCVPKEYKKWLTQVYGNYMQLPSIEKRVTHHKTVAIDVSRPYTDYIQNYVREQK